MKNIHKSFPGVRALRGVDFHLNKGEIHALMGENGAGKSTTIRHLMGFSKPDSGSTKIFGMETFDKYYEILANVGYIPGEIALPAGLTGKAFIKMMQDLQHCHNQPQLKRMLDLFELDDTALAGETKRMSLGVKRKLAVVTAFMSDPDVLNVYRGGRGSDFRRTDQRTRPRDAGKFHRIHSRGKETRQDHFVIQPYLFGNRQHLRPHRDHQRRQNRFGIRGGRIKRSRIISRIVLFSPLWKI